MVVARSNIGQQEDRKMIHGDERNQYDLDLADKTSRRV
jgi:hypothetical protein